MKKILLLSALLGGFVLNNGYCYDANHKITKNTISKFFTVNYNRDNFINFGKEFLTSKIPGSGTVAFLLRGNKLSNDHVRTICDNSLGSSVNTDEGGRKYVTLILDDNRNILISQNPFYGVMRGKKEFEVMAVYENHIEKVIIDAEE